MNTYTLKLPKMYKLLRQQGLFQSQIRKKTRTRKEKSRSIKTVPGPTRPSSGYLKLLRNYWFFLEKKPKRCDQESFGKCFILPFFKINAQF
jgi:hypothetical protein